MKVAIITVSDFVLQFIYSESGLALQVLGIFPSQAIKAAELYNSRVCLSVDYDSLWS